MINLLVVGGLFLFSQLEGSLPIKFDQTAIASYCKQARKCKKYEVLGTGQNNRMNRLILMLSSREKITLPEARRKIVEEAQTLLYHLNKRKQNCKSTIPPFISEENLQFSIAFGDKNTLFFESPYIAKVGFMGDWILYQNFDLESMKFTIILEEPYAEALRIVQEEACDTVNR